MPRIDDVLSAWELLHVWCLQERPRGCESFPQHVCDTFCTLSTDPGYRERSHVEKRAKECGEKHYFREDEPKHPLSIRAVQLIAVKPLCFLLDLVFEPAKNHVKQHQETGSQNPRT